MLIHRTLRGLSAALALGAAGVAAADPSSDAVSAKLEALESKVRAQQTEIDRLHANQSNSANWLDQRRAEEVKGLIREVLADADTRASLLQDGATAGFSDGFFIGSADGGNLLKIRGEAQIRYIFSDAVGKPAADADEEDAGFQLRRVRLYFTGHFGNKNLTYGIRPSFNRANGNVQLDNAWVAYQFAEGWKVTAGQFKPQFLREENVGGFEQLAVERSYTADYFTIDYSQGIEVSYEGDWIRGSIVVHDGSYTGFGTATDFNADVTDIAVGGRVEIKVAGDWKQFRDFTVWSNEQFGLLIGAGVNYEEGESGVDAVGTANADVFKYTVDGSLEIGAFNFFAAFIGQHFNDNGRNLSNIGGVNLSNLDNSDQWAIVVQGGVFVVPDIFEVFARYEYIDFDRVYYRNNGGTFQGGSRNLNGEDDLGIVTVGTNYYVKKHNVKFTLDVLFALNPVPVDNTGGGQLRATRDDQTTVRAQAQFKF